jgi:hypothetical protein
VACALALRRRTALAEQPELRRAWDDEVGVTITHVLGHVEAERVEAAEERRIAVFTRTSDGRAAFGGLASQNTIETG